MEDHDTRDDLVPSMDMYVLLRAVAGVDQSRPWPDSNYELRRRELVEQLGRICKAEGLPMTNNRGIDLLLNELEVAGLAHLDGPHLTDEGREMINELLVASDDMIDSLDDFIRGNH